MKKLLKRLTPNAFRRIDDYFLRNYPTVWQTRGHWVFYAFILSIILFIAGYCTPNTFTNPLVHPIKPIEITEENYFLIPFTFAVIAVLYWGFTQYQYQYKFDEVKSLKVIATLLIYGIGLFVILGLDTTAFRLGTIVRTSNLMLKSDLRYIENKDYFLYGFFPHDSIKRGNEEKYFGNDSIFSGLREREYKILTKRYDKKYLSDLSDRLDLLNLSSRFDISYTSYFSYHSSLSDKLYLSDILSYRSDIPYRLYRSDLSDLSDQSRRSDLSDLSDKRFVKDNDAYQVYYKIHIFPELNTDSLSDYGLDFSFKKFKYENLTFDIPQYFYPLEDGVRSVRHALQYLDEKIIYRYFKMVLQYLPFVLMLFFTVSFLSQKNILAALVLGLVVYFLSNYFHSIIEDSEIQLEVYSSYRMAVLAILSLIITSFSIFINHENRITIFFLHLFIVAAIGTVLIPIFIENEDAADYGEDGIYYIKTWVFYLTAAMCLIAPVLFSYLKGLPKSR